MTKTMQNKLANFGYRIFIKSFFITGFFFLSISASASTCSLLSSADTPQIGFGAAYNTLSQSKELLMKTDCVSSTQVKAEIGNGQAAQYIYKNGYIWLNNKWEAITYQPSGQYNANWLVGKATADITLSAEQMAKDNYILAYVCTWTGTTWKCGCRDSACTKNYWQLQKFKYSCSPDWTCSNWSVCQADNTRTRTCADSNNCGTVTNKSTLTQACAYSGNCQDNDGDAYDNCSPGQTGDDGKAKDCDDIKAMVSPGVIEICGNQIDDNCSGQADENCVCQSGLTQACGPEAIGACKKGVQTCYNGQWQTCTGAVYPKAEVCGNGIDEDCNGADATCLDAAKPVVSAFSIAPSAVTAGSPVTASFTVADNTALQSVELWRAASASTCSDTSKTDCAWTKITEKTITGKTYSGQLSDKPAAGTYYYGLHAIDSSGNQGTENTSVKIIVNPACQDNDADGYDNCSLGQTGDDGKTIDCNDANPAINPGASEICGNRIDEDCSGLTFDNDSCDNNKFLITEVLGTSDYLANPSVFLAEGKYYLFGFAADISPRSDGKYNGGIFYDADTKQKYDLILDLGGYTGITNDLQAWNYWLYKHTDGKYHLYAGMHIGGFSTNIIHFVPSDSNASWTGTAPIKNWKFDKLLLGYTNPGSNFYDVSLIRDQFDKLYLTYVGTDQPGLSNAIYITNMIDPRTIGAVKTKILSATDYNSEAIPELNNFRLVEAASIAYIQNKYVLSYSTGFWANKTYHMGFAYADNVSGPYHKVAIDDLANIWGNAVKKDIKYIIQSAESLWPNFTDQVKGPGAGVIVKRSDSYYVYLHAYSNSEIAGSDGLYNGDHRRVYRFPINIDMAKTAAERITWGDYSGSVCIDLDKDGFDNCRIGDINDDGNIMDCNDNEYWANPAGLETCDTIDNNCNGATDENCDSDKDGYCSSAKTIYRSNSMCRNTIVSNYEIGGIGDDCNDGNAAIHPGATETCGNQVDEDCSGADASCSASCGDKVCNGTETCTSQICVPACIDECKSGESGCVGQNAIWTCGEAGDSDACLEKINGPCDFSIGEKCDSDTGKCRVILGLYSPISSPIENQIFTVGNEIYFSAWAQGGSEPYTYKWQSDVSGVIGNQGYFSTSILPAGKHEITLTAKDESGAQYISKINISIISDLVIYLYLDKYSYYSGQNIFFNTWASGGTAPYSYSWISDMDGTIGSQSGFMLNSLSVGIHKITVRASDSAGKIGNKIFYLEIKKPDCVDNDSDGYGINGFFGDKTDYGCRFAGHDCNDSNSAINPAAPENCYNGIDDNCDGRIDECDIGYTILSPVENFQLDWARYADYRIDFAEKIDKVRMNVYDSNNNIKVTQVLYDDGLHNDGLANDNKFGLYFPLLLPQGPYRIEFEILIPGSSTYSKLSQTRNIAIANVPQCTTVVNNGLPADKLDLVFIASGYDDLSVFSTKVNEIWNWLITINPFDAHKNKINIHRIDAPAYAKDLVRGAYAEVSSLCPFDSTMVLINQSARSHAIIGGNIAYVYTAGGGLPNGISKVAVHELGHSFGNLYDEYVSLGFNNSYARPGGVNCDDSPVCSKWNNIPGTGCFKGCTYDSWYRSIDNGIMYSGSTDFGIININHLNNLFEKYK